MSEFAKFNCKEKIKRTILMIVCIIILLSFLIVICIISINLPGKWESDLLEIDYHEHHFKNYLKKFGKSYDNVTEYRQRLKNFKENLKEIKRLNQLHNGTVKFGLTSLSDMSQEEFENTLLIKGIETGLTVSYPCTTNNSEIKSLANKTGDLPLVFDWRNKHYVGPVRSQGLCKSCWAHSVVGVMESMMFINNLTRKYIPLSIQELLNCDVYDHQCGGGSGANALSFLCNRHYPIIHENQYRLTNKNGTCLIENADTLPGVLIADFTTQNDLPPMEIAAIVARHGPVVVSVDSKPWMHYLGGVIQYHCTGEIMDLDHVVQIVGYNMVADIPYFIIKNSWGTDWGDNGYVYISMDSRFICGLGRQIVYFDVTVRGNFLTDD